MRNKRDERIGEERVNNQGCLMKIVKYNNANDIVVEFQDKYGGTVHTNYTSFKNNSVKNPFHPCVFGVRMIGDKYPAKIGERHTKEYKAWRSMIIRSYDDKYKNAHPTYANVYVCDEWLLYSNFYEWLHLQQNFDKWYREEQWNVDKDILKKGNKIYSPDTCVLVPNNVNKLFTNHESARGKCPVGVTYDKKWGKYIASCNNPFSPKGYSYFGGYCSKEDAFNAYKNGKEKIIKMVAEEEFNKGNITKECHDAMLKYKIEITD